MPTYRFAHGLNFISLFIALPWTLLLSAAPALANGAQPGTTISVAAEVSNDPEMAFITGRYELIQAANAGDGAALNRGLALISNAAESGYAPAARFAGTLFMDGTMVPRDRQRAVTWLQRAAELGDPEAQSILGNLYADGTLLPADPEHAAEWYEALLDNPSASEFPRMKWAAADRLAQMYADKSGVTFQPDRARALWGQAASEGAYPPALEALARATANGIGAPADPDQALRLYYDAAMAYHGGAIRYGIAPDAYRHAEADILAAMESLDPRHKLTRRLQRHIESER
ncbi:MAG: sel1 repeat family protein [Nitrospirota bacterium]|nr:sel1 repeat family protein [Nitrospirota bacterium]